MTEKRSVNVYYPIEAFALAMILFSKGMKLAMIVGIGLIVGDVLLHVLKENFDAKYKYAVIDVGILITMAAIAYATQYAGFEIDIKTMISYGALAVLLAKHHNELEDGEPDYNRILFEDSIAYVFLVLLSIVREFISGGTIFGIKLVKLGFMSHSYSKAMFALILAGIMIGILNGIFKCECSKNAALWVCIPAILLEVPFVWNNVPEWAGSAVAMIFMVIIYMTFRKKVALSNVSKHLKGLPLELVTLGMMYMIFSIL